MAENKQEKENQENQEKLQISPINNAKIQQIYNQDDRDGSISHISVVTKTTNQSLISNPPENGIYKNLFFYISVAYILFKTLQFY